MKSRGSQPLSVVLHHVFGTTEAWVLFRAALVIVAVAIVAESIARILELPAQLVGGHLGWSEMATSVVTSGFVITIITGLLWGVLRRARRGPAELKLDIALIDHKPPRVRVLILLLSQPAPPLQARQRITDAGTIDRFRVTLTSSDSDAPFRHNWEQPLRAIACHLETIERLVVLTSSGEKGSHHHMDDFRQVVAGVFLGRGINVVTLKEHLRSGLKKLEDRSPNQAEQFNDQWRALVADDLASVGIGANDQAAIDPPSLAFGLDPENPRILARVLNLAWEAAVESQRSPSLGRIWIKTAGADPVTPEHVVIDVTSGHKPTSIAAAISAYPSGRVFQYVTNDKKVKFYDIAYLT